jgi:hypothetical protein
VAHAAEVFCSGFLVEAEQMVRVEFLSRPLLNQILETDLGRLAVNLHVILELLMTLDVHVAGALISVFNGGLWSPMRPNTAFGISIQIIDLPFLK